MVGHAYVGENAHYGFYPCFFNGMAGDDRSDWPPNLHELCYVPPKICCKTKSQAGWEANSGQWKWPVGSLSRL